MVSDSKNVVHLLHPWCSYGYLGMPKEIPK
jgi:hypothetical protein